MAANELTLHPKGAASVLLAAISTSGRITAPIRVSWQLPAASPDQAEIRLTRIEALYAYIVRQEPLRRIELTHSGRARPLPAASHGSTLRKLADGRAS